MTERELFEQWYKSRFPSFWESVQEAYSNPELQININITKQFEVDFKDWQDARQPLLERIAELEQALQAYREARAMPSYGNYAEIDYTPPEMTYDISYGGGDCNKHGRYYGRCFSCAETWDKLRKKADMDAVHARDNALQKADEQARKALEGGNKCSESR